MDNVVSAKGKTDAVSVDQFRSALDERFSLLDRNGNGYLSSNELVESLRNQKAMGSNARVVEAAIENLHALELLWNDEWGTENNGISRNDIGKFDDLTKSKPDSAVVSSVKGSLRADERDPEKFISLLNIYKPRMDLDQSGTLSKYELDHYVKTSIDGSGPVGVASLLRDHFDFFNEIGSKNSTGAYNLLPGDADKKTIGAGELESIATVLRSEAAFRERVWDVHRKEVSSGNEIGKQGRTLFGDGKDGAAALIGIGLEAWGHMKSTNTAKPESLIQDFEARKAMLDSWKFFKARAQ